MSTQAKILIVDDEDDIRELLSYNLDKEGYIVFQAGTGQEAIDIAKIHNPHLIILDIMMPEMDGIEVCIKLRQEPEFKNTVIAFLTAREESFTQIQALESGGDDFINKPIKINVLKSRIKALLRRHIELNQSNKDEIQTFGDLTINFNEYKVILGEKEMVLAKKEFDLLNLLVSKPGKVFQRNVILDRVWGKDVIVGDRTIDVHIRKLREKIGNNYIVTHKGIGYKFDF